MSVRPGDPIPESAAAIAREFCEYHRLVNDAEPALEKLISRIRLDAQVSAHLEDARAGCYLCASPKSFGAAEKRSDWLGYWHRHLQAREAFQCSRPEIQDALLKLKR